MEYRSTRGNDQKVSAAKAITTGLAPDGGLYVPCAFPKMQADLSGLTYEQTAVEVLKLFLTDYTPEFLQSAAEKAYRSFGDGAGKTVSVPGHGVFLELWHGPTCAFKDYALQLMPHLLVEGKKLLDDKRLTHILVATSGDTGKAALAGYAGLDGIRISVFYPQDGTSRIQELQMVTQTGENVAVYAVKGNFDDAQSGVKRAFGDKELAQELAEKGAYLSSANSINWGRLAPQIVYYFYCYEQLVAQGTVTRGQAVDFCVPTGNFGDILAGWYAKQMGLPVGRLICASNENDVLTEFLSTGVYNARRPFYKTESPSMDILVSSNLERLLYHVTSDAAQVKEWMDTLSREGRYEVSEAVLQEIQKTFACASVDAAGAAEEIASLYKESGYLMDPHTAVAYAAAKEQAKENVCVVLSTASPYKFPGSVLKAVGQPVPQDEFEALKELEQFSKLPAPEALKNLQTMPVRFTQIIEKEQILDVARG